MELWQEQEIVRYANGTVQRCTDRLIREAVYEICVNGCSCDTVVCSPDALEELALGVAFAAGKVCADQQVERIFVEEGRIDLTLAQKRQVLPSVEETCLSAAQIWELCADFNGQCMVFGKTGAAHAVGVATKEGLTLLREDVSRTGALWKAMGAALMQNTAMPVLIFSGRLSGEMLEYVSGAGAQILLCNGAATAQAVQRAKELGITLVGFIRQGYLNVYTHPERIR